MGPGTAVDWALLEEWRCVDRGGGGGAWVEEDWPIQVWWMVGVVCLDEFNKEEYGVSGMVGSGHDPSNNELDRPIYKFQHILPSAIQKKETLRNPMLKKEKWDRRTWEEISGEGGDGERGGESGYQRNFFRASLHGGGRGARGVSAMEKV
ncbi:hypothetical protein L1987_05597 [Smallanthus sonchifolius]|uniref:Uncharacterized protein n=1 Tax=Smallanthus sonchifolius TaxID=185202 RepID=A0ACB9JW37_9ASTR|nr:hypothetical protein L1987_05597 [Smallanthus sonchifolius]